MNRNKKDVKFKFPVRLQKICKFWQEMTKPMLKHRKKLLESWASGFYEDGYTRSHTLNLIDRGVGVVVPYLVEGDPKVLVETKIPALRPFAFTTQLAMNHFIKKMKLAKNVLIPAASNSMFGLAVARTSLEWDRDVTLKDKTYRIGTPKTIIIDDSNYIGDPSAKRIEDFQIEGDVYQLPTAYAKEFFGAKYADDIKADYQLKYDISPRDISAGRIDRKLYSLREYTTFIDLYLYDENVIVTIMPEGNKAVILKTIDNDFPGSPYDKLFYKGFPEQPYPIPPAWNWHDIDVTVNILVDKMREQAESQKNILAFEGRGENDAERIRTAPNNSVVRVDDIQALKEVAYGGVNPENYQYVAYMETQFTKQGGNPDVLGGRGAQAPTLGQEQMVFANASRIVNNMIGQFHDFMASIVRKLAWGFWTDPTVYVPLVKEIPGVATIPTVFSQAEEVADFYEFTFDIVPYSTQRGNPERNYQKMMMFLTQWIIPTMEIAASQGSVLDVNEINKILAGYLGLDNFNQWYKTAVPTGLDNINYKMMPIGNKSQSNDQFGASPASRMANMFGQQARAGGESSPNQQTGQKEVI